MCYFANARTWVIAKVRNKLLLALRYDVMCVGIGVCVCSVFDVCE